MKKLPGSPDPSSRSDLWDVKRVGSSSWRTLPPRKICNLNDNIINTENQGSSYLSPELHARIQLELSLIEKELALLEILLKKSRNVEID
jgi:hypothetical protein